MANTLAHTPDHNGDSMSESEDLDDKAAMFTVKPPELVHCLVRHGSKSHHPRDGFDIIRKLNSGGTDTSTEHVDALLDLLPRAPAIGYDLSGIIPTLVEYLEDELDVRNASRQIASRIVTLREGRPLVAAICSSGDVFEESFPSPVDFYLTYPMLDSTDLDLEDLGCDGVQGFTEGLVSASLIIDDADFRRADFVSDEANSKIRVTVATARAARAAVDAAAHAAHASNNVGELVKGPTELYYKHLEEVKDVETQGEITPATDIAQLYQIQRTDWALKNMSARSRALPASMLFDTTTMPMIKFANGTTQNMGGINMKASIFEMMSAPAIEIKLSYMDTLQTTPIASASFHIPFTGEKHLEDFKVAHNAETYAYVFDWTFLCNGATNAGGLAKLLNCTASFSAHDHAVLQLMTDMTKRDYTPRQIHLQQYQPPPRRQKKQQQPNGDEWATMDDEETALAPYDHNVKETFDHLPGNPDGGYVPRTFSTLPYKGFRRLSNNIAVLAHGMPRPYLLCMTYKDIKAPMIPFPNVFVFSSMDEYRVKMSQAVEGEYREEALQYRYICNPEPDKHTVRFWHIGSMVIAIITLSIITQVNRQNSFLARLCIGTKVSLKWLSRKSEHIQQASGFVFSPGCYFPQNDLAIFLTNRDSASLGHGSSAMGKSWKNMTELSQNGLDKVWPPSHPVDLDIKPNDTVCKQQMMTVNIATSSHAQQWHQYILNQRLFEEMPTVDFTSRNFAQRTDQTDWNVRVENAYTKVLSFKPVGEPDFKWNDEQLEVLACTRSNAGKMKFVSGPAGAGKTSLQEAIMTFFVDLGFTVIYDAPANSNVTDYTQRFRRDFPKINFICAVASSAEFSLGDDCLGTDMNEPTREGFEHDVIFDLFKMELHTQDKKRKFADSHEFRVRQRVIATAKDNSRSDWFSYDMLEKNDLDANNGINSEGIWKDDDVSYIHPKTVNVKANPRAEPFPLWPRLLTLLKRAEREKISDWEDATGSTDEQAIKEFKALYNHATKIIIGTAQIMCCTSAVSAGKLVRNNFASGKYEPKPIGVIIIKDECTRDTEPNFLGTLVNCAWSDNIVGVFAFGDHKQLQPTVTGTSNNFTISHAPYQLRHSFFNRLISEGMPHTELTKQGRMHEYIAAIASKYVYENKLEAAESRKRSLEQDIPGRDIVTKLRKLYVNIGATHVEDRTEQCLRLQGFEIDGSVAINDRNSKVNPEQNNFVLEHIVPVMQAVYGSETSTKCRIIIGYSESVYHMRKGLNKMREVNKNLTAEMMPVVQTIDSAQGTQAEWVVFVTTINEGDKLSDLGFLKDNHRVNVALTRAMHIMTIVHSKLEGGRAYDKASLDVPAKGGRDQAPTPLLFVVVKLLCQQGLTTRYH